MSKVSWGKYVDDWNENDLPYDFRPILFLRGSAYEMGKQYGEAMSALIKRNFCTCEGIVLRSILNQSEDVVNAHEKEIEDSIEVQIEKMREYTPDIMKYWEGMADGAGVTLGDIGLINLFMWYIGLFEDHCSTIAARDSCTVDGKVICGINDDVTWANNGYGPIIMAFPDEGNAFLTVPGIAGQLSCNFAMNEKGLAITFTGGECARPEDLSGDYWDFITLLNNMVWKCDTAAEARTMFDKVPVKGGWSFLFADASRDISITEATSAISHNRVPGEHGEKDFILVTNHFVDEGMRVASFPGNEDSYNRYNTEEKLLHEKHGHIDLIALKNILGCPDYWDGQSWHMNSWGFDDMATATEHSYFTPEMRAPDFKPAFRCLAEPEDRKAHILMGGRDLGNAYCVRPMGQYLTLYVGSDEASVCNEADHDAMMEIWNAAKYISQNNCNDKDKRLAELSEAKAAFWQGRNCQAKAECCRREPVKARKYYAEATSRYTKTMLLARKAREADKLV